jgi:hypothetical protein
VPTRFGVRSGGVHDGRKLRKVVGTVFGPHPTGREPGRLWELLDCGHEGRPVPADDRRATQRWCDGCKNGWPTIAESEKRP